MKKILMLVGGILLSWNAAALELAGVKLADTAQLGKVSLQLNGAGIRSKFFFKIYVGALYLPQKQTSGEAVIESGSEYRMELHILRELSGEKLFNAFNSAIEANHSLDEIKSLDAQSKQMAHIFEEVKVVKPGDVIMLDYLPESGVHVSVNNKTRGLISGAEFDRALLKVWLGSKPAQQDLKKGLLGG